MTKVKAITIATDEKYLRQVSKKVALNDPNLENDIKLLDEYCKEHEVFAMAAVQIGIPKRIIYLKNTDLEIANKEIAEKRPLEEAYNESRILINPTIVSREGLTEYWEACASCLDNFGKVRRPYKIKLEYYDIEGNKQSAVFEGFESTVLSHENDHLDGILHIDIADELLIMNAEQRTEFRKTHGYNIISKTGEYEELLKTDIKVLQKSN